MVSIPAFSRGGDREPKPLAEIIVFLALLVVALLLEFLVLPLPQLALHPAWHRFVEHITITLFAAIILGLTYEMGFYSHRKRILREVLSEFKEEVSATLKGIGTLSPIQIFNLLRDIASSPLLTPTLYYPPRSPHEYNFVENNDYFDKLIHAAREEVIEILRTWLEPESHKNAKFLASDFIGKYKLHELKGALHARAEKKFQSWNELAEGDQDWVLNYLWAASRCENPMYESLGAKLISTPHSYVQEWILFVPRQMPDKEFVRIIGLYLEKNKSRTPEATKASVWALAALSSNHHNVLTVIGRNARHLAQPEFLEEIRKAWQHYSLDPQEVLELLADGGRGIPLRKKIRDKISGR